MMIFTTKPSICFFNTDDNENIGRNNYHRLTPTRFDVNTIIRANNINPRYDDCTQHSTATLYQAACKQKESAICQDLKTAPLLCCPILVERNLQLPLGDLQARNRIALKTKTYECAANFSPLKHDITWQACYSYYTLHTISYCTSGRFHLNRL